MLAWRTRFIYSVSLSIMSPAFDGRRFHRGHARGMLGRHRFQQRAINLQLDVARQQAAQQLRRRSARKCNPPVRLRLRHFDRQQPRRSQLRRHHALEFVDEQVDRVDFAALENAR